MGSPEVDWERLDKTKVFLVGVPLFSAVTTALYPLTVIKTRQMASHDVAGGLRGSLDTAAAIWRADGARGFYRGFGTIVCGMIPARTVYLTSLEATKAALQRSDAMAAALAPSAHAGAANFVAGGVASLVTQLVAVPVDVVSQRLMVHGADLGGGGNGGSSGGNGGRVNSSSSTSASGAQARSFSSAAWSSSSSSGGGGSRQPAWRSPAFVGVCERLQRRPQQAGYSTGIGGGGIGGGGGAAQAGAAAAGAATSAAAPRAAAAAAAAGRMNGYTMARLIVREEGLRGLWRGLVPSAALYVPNSAIWWGCYGGWQSLIWLYLHPEAAGTGASSSFEPGSSSSVSSGGISSGNSSNSSISSSSSSISSSTSAGTGEIVAVQTAAAALAGACSALVTTPLDVLKTRLQVSGGGSGGSSSSGGTRGSSRSVIGSSGSGSSSSSKVGGGGGASWGGILRELLREEGARGLWRGLAPRVASSSVFGVAMTVTYQSLKRWCALPELGAEA